MKRRLLILVVFAVLLAAEALWLLPDLWAAQSPERPAAPPDVAAPAEPAPVPQLPPDPMAAYRRLPERPAPPAAAPAGWYAPQAADSGDIERLPPAVLGEAADYSYAPSVSADGRYTAFYSYAGNLAFGDMDGLPDVFVYDRQTGQTEMVSVDNYGYNVFGYFYDPSISDDGRYVAFLGWTYYLVDYTDEWRGDIYVHDRQTGVNTRVSVKSNGAHANDNSYYPYLSADGVNVVFMSYANNLVNGDTNGNADIFLHNRNTGVTSRISLKAANTQANGFSYDPSISADGRYVAFSSEATNLVTGDTNGTTDIFVRDVTGKTTARASVGGGGAQSNAWASDPIISDNGRYVAFASGADNLTPDDGDTSSDVFIRDRQTNTTTLVSRDAAGNPSDGWAQWPSLSADGSLVAFDDHANLAPGGNGWQNVYVRNWQTGTIVRASVDSSGAPAEGAFNGVLSADGSAAAFGSYDATLVGSDTNGVDDVYLRRLNVNQTLRVSGVAFAYTEPNSYSAYPAPSLDGRYVAYTSYAGNLVPGDSGNDPDVFVTDRQTDVTTVVSTDANGYIAGDVLEKVDISDNGRYVAFAGWRSYVEYDYNDRYDVFVRDRQTNTTTLVSVNSAGEQGDLDSYDPSLSGDGNLVAFVSAADNLVPNDNNGMVDAFVHNRTTGVTTRVSLTAAGAEATWDTGQIDIAAAGRFVAMASIAALTPDSGGGYAKVYVRDLQTGALELISRTYDGSDATGSSISPVISSDGRYVAFESWASNLVVDDANGDTTDIFLYDRQTDQMTLVSRSYDSGPAYSSSTRPSISHDGRYVGFSSYADNLVPDDFNYSEDVFVYDRVNGSIGRASVNAAGEEANYTSGGAALSGDGSKVAFGSYADNLVPNDTYGFKDVFITDRPAGSSGGDSHNVYFISPSGNGNVGGIAFTGADILRYTRSSNTWQMIYDGSARGTPKNVGAFDLLGDGSLLLVFSANQVIPGLGTATPRDVVLFEPFDPLSYPLGAGTYSWYMRGADSGLTTKTEAIDALYWSFNGIDLAPELTISTKGAAAVGPNGSLKAQDEDGIVCTLFDGVCDWKPALTLNLTTIPGMAAENVTGLARGHVNSNTYVTLAGPFNLGGVSGNAKSIVRLTPSGASWNVAAIDWLAPGASFPSNLDGLSLIPAYDPYP